jgi:hypothetical protein
VKRPGLKKRLPRSAPIVQRELHALMHPIKPKIVTPTLPDQLGNWIQARVRSFGSACLRFSFRWPWA